MRVNLLKYEKKSHYFPIVSLNFIIYNIWDCSQLIYEAKGCLLRKI